VDLGSGPITFVAGDDVIYNGTVWQRSPSGVTVTSVAGKTGDVVLDKNDVGLGNVDNTSDLDKPISTAVQNALDLKLDASEISNYYTKTQMQTSGQAQMHWDNITNVPGDLGKQTLSLSSNAGRISISGGNSVDLASVAAPTYSGSFEDFNPNIGLWVYRLIGGSTGYPGGSGGGIRFNRNSTNNSGAFDIFKVQGTSPKLYYTVGLNGPWEQYTFASEEWVTSQGFLTATP